MSCWLWPLEGGCAALQAFPREAQRGQTQRAGHRQAVHAVQAHSPSMSMDAWSPMRSSTSAALPAMARPTRHVSPTMRPLRLRMQLTRCSVLSMPARLSPPNSPTWGGGQRPGWD